MADFTPQQCMYLPARYVNGCLYGAQAQDIQAHRPDPIAERQRLFAEYEAGTAFTYQGCLLLPTDTVEGCQEAFPATANRPTTPTTPASPPASATPITPAVTATTTTTGTPVPGGSANQPAAGAASTTAPPATPDATAPSYALQLSAAPEPDVSLDSMLQVGLVADVYTGGTVSAPVTNTPLDIQVAWGDGTTSSADNPQPQGVGAPESFTLDHTYAQTGSYTISVQLLSAAGGAAVWQGTTTYQAAVCFSLRTGIRCGNTSATQEAALPTIIAGVMAECGSGFMQSPVGCLLASSSAAVGVSRGDAPAGDYYVWLATGDLFTCAYPTCPRPAVAARSSTGRSSAAAGT